MNTNMIGSLLAIAAMGVLPTASASIEGIDDNRVTSATPSPSVTVNSCDAKDWCLGDLAMGSRGLNIVKDTTVGTNGIAWEFTGQAVVTMRSVDNLFSKSRFSGDAPVNGRKLTTIVLRASAPAYTNFSGFRASYTADIGGVGP